ncbi:MAG TPA: M28 family peptidase [Chitinophagales bacterium]|nr:M28 family peptidase [Chitinophagales bacterium]
MSPFGQHPFNSVRFRSCGWRYAMNFLFFSFTIHYSPFTSCAQSPVLTYAHYVIDTLTSRTMDGRGYVDSSDFKAATFIQHEFQNMDVRPFTGDFFQPFTFDANVFPGKMKLHLNWKKMQPGKDFLVDASSDGEQGIFRVIKLKKDPADTSMLALYTMIAQMQSRQDDKLFFAYHKSDFSKKQYDIFHAAIMDHEMVNPFGIIEVTNGKLTWDASQQVLPFCMLQVKDSSLKKIPLSVRLNIDQQFKPHYISRNVAAIVEGSSIPDSFIVFTAHYDHLGQMGDGTWFPGANDNASGTSMVLNLAKYFSEHPSKYSVVFICFSGEELGLLGSMYFVNNPLFALDKIKFLVNLDIVGTGDEGIKVVNATEFPKQFDQLVKLNDEHHYVKQVAPRGKAANSDHYPFYMNQVPCFFIYTMGGIAAYHDIYDRAETLPLTKYDELFKLLIDFENSF